MTPAVKILKKAKTPFTLHQYDHDPECTSFGEEAAMKLGLDPSCVFKTLVAELDDSRLAVSVIPITKMLDLKALAKEMGVKKAQMAEIKNVERTTGYIVGGVSPLGQKKKLPTLIDDSAQDHATIFISGGRRGLDIEISPQDLKTLTRAVFATLGK